MCLSLLSSCTAPLLDLAVKSGTRVVDRQVFFVMFVLFSINNYLLGHILCIYTFGDKSVNIGECLIWQCRSPN